jgi:vitamin B12 transporter
MNFHPSICILSTAIFLSAISTTDISAEEHDTIGVINRLDSSIVIREKASPTRSVMAQTAVFDRNLTSSASCQTLESVLRVSPSIDVRERGGKAVQADISIRGGSFDQTQVMLNGINFTDARTGHQTHALPVDIDCISEIELLDGVLGVGAYAGAINFKTSPLFPNYIRANISGGQYGYAYANLSGARQFGRTEVFSAASYKRSDGYISNTDFKNINAYSRATINLGKAGDIDIQAGFQARDFGANGFYSLKFPNQFESTRTALASARYLLQSTSGWELSASIHARACTDLFELIRGDESKVPFNHHLTMDLGAEFWAGRDWKLGRTTVGCDWTRNGVLSTVLGEKLDDAMTIGHSGFSYTRHASRNTENFWLRHNIQRNLWSLAFSGGASAHPYGFSGMGSAEFSLYPAKGLRAYVGAVSSMRLPTFTDLYYTATGYVSNSALVPEKAVMVRAGAEFSSNHWNFTALGYWRKGKDIIDWIMSPKDSLWHSMQITSMNTLGAEFGVRWHASQGMLRNASITYSHIYGDKDSEGYISRYALDYMRNKLSCNAALSFFRDFSLTATGTLYDRAGTNDPYFLLDARCSWTRKWLELFVEASNITCTQYSDFTGLKMPSIWADAGIILTIK